MESNRRKVSRVALIVLGMHRSGTSALAGALTLLGCDGPATPMKPTSDNAKGYFEPAPLYPLHSKLLESAASSWDDWLPVGASWLNSVQAEEFQSCAATLIQEQFGKSCLFVLKDPRICRLVPFWAKVLDDIDVTPRYILTHRNPLEVAQSLNMRNGMEIEIALLIWLRHVLDAEASTRGKRRCFTSYAELMTNWNLVGQKIEIDLKVSLPRLSAQAPCELEEFLSSKLRHQTVAAEQALTDARTAGWVQTVFGILEKWVARGESDADFDTLDTVREQFDSSANAYARPLQLMQNVQQELKKLSSDSTQWAEERKTLAREVETLRADRAQVVADLEARLQHQQSAQQTALQEAREAAKTAKIDLAKKTAAFTEERDRQNAAIHQAQAERDRIAEERKDLATKFEALRISRAKLEEQTATLEAERHKVVSASEAQGKAHETRIAELEMELAVTRGALDERRMTASQADAALAELRDRMIERESAHERTLAALKGDLEQRLRESETALTEAVLMAEDRLDQAATLRTTLEAEHARALEALTTQAGTLAAEVQTRETALEEMRTALAEQTAAALTAEGALERLQEMLEERDAYLIQSCSALKQRRHELNQYSGTIATLQAELAEAQAALQKAEVNAGERETVLMGRLADRETLMQQLELSLDERNRELAELTQIIARRETEQAEAERAAEDRVATLRAERDTLSAERELLHRARDVQRVENDALKADVSEARAALQRTEKAVSEREAALIGQVHERDTRLRNAEHALAERYREFAHLAQLVVTRESERDEESRKLALRGEEIEALKRQMAALEAERDAQRAYIAELFVSRSWKVTQPLRSVTTAVRRVLGRA